MSHARIIIFLILAAAIANYGQSGRMPAADAATQAGDVSAGDVRTVKQMFDEANGYIRSKAAEFEAKKTPFSETLLTKTKLEQRQLAAKYATLAGGRAGLAGDDFYYLGMLHWIAENLDGTADSLRKYIAVTDADALKKQMARSVVIVVLAKQNNTGDAEILLAEYLKSGPTKLTESARFEGELAKAYQSQRDFVQMAPHAEQGYKAVKELLSDPTSHVRRLDEVLDAGMLVFEAYRDIGDRAKAEAALDDMQATAIATASPSFFFYAADQKVRYLIDTGRKPKAMEFYASAIDTAGKSFPSKDLIADAVNRLKKKEQHYKLLGASAPEFADTVQWLAGEPKTLADLKGKVVLIDFWATWCGPCLGAFPELIEWRKDFAADGFEILGLTRFYGAGYGLPTEHADELEYLKQFRKREGLTYPFVIADGQALQLQYGAMSLPTTVLIDRKGVVRYIESGTGPERLAEIREILVKLLAEK